MNQQPVVGRNHELTGAWIPVLVKSIYHHPSSPDFILFSTFLEFMPHLFNGYKTHCT